ncbi:hypothetical protein TNCV_1771141 [Trichonephila clavipes]|nr:hypothetical protein TNCV_1771141 [Trichonephila clavipes]
MTKTTPESEPHSPTVLKQCKRWKENVWSSVLQAMTKRVLFQRRSGASASFVHVVLRKSAEVEVLMREVG